MSNHDSLGDRMKRYEHAAQQALPPRIPVILRVDGRAFHTFTRGMTRPFDERLILAMDMVAIALCEEIAGAQVAYVQSDEISVLIHTYKRFHTQAWFANEIQKMTSVAASVASSEMTLLYRARCSFDARVFVMPETDVNNYFLWRQQDAMRNSLQMVTRAHYSSGECERQDQRAMREMLLKKGIDWDELPIGQQRGRCAVRESVPGEGVVRSSWTIDDAIPIFSADRAYIEKHLATEPEDAETTVVTAV